MTVSVSAALGQNAATERMAKGSLAWYFHWATQPGQRAQVCNRYGLGQYMLYYCGREKVVIEIDMRLITRRSRITSAFGPEDQVIAEFRRNRSTSDRPLDVTKLPPVSFTAGELAYNADLALSKGLHDIASKYVMEVTKQATSAKHGSVSVYYPLASSDDPQYWVVVTVGGVVAYVYEFELRNKTVSPHPFWTYDQEHKNIPRGLAAAVKQRSRWFVVSKLGQPQIR